MSSGGHLSVNIAASGCCDPNGDLNRLVHAVSVSQSSHQTDLNQHGGGLTNQQWTVIREYHDFVNLGNALPLPEQYKIPPATHTISIRSPNDVSRIASARNALQQWISNLLLFPTCQNSPALRHFLTHDANIVPSYLENLSWLSFQNHQNSHPQQHHGNTTNNTDINNNNGSTNNSTNNSNISDTPNNSSTLNSGNNSNINNNAHTDEMEMDEMFNLDHDDDGDDDDNADHDYDDDDDDLVAYSASARYQPTEEAVTQEDAMEIQQAGDLEMIQDVGSLAQSLGASHLGRSLQLQAQHMKHLTTTSTDPDQPQSKLSNSSNPLNSGLTLGKTTDNSSSKAPTTAGGIGDIVQSAAAAAPQASQAVLQGLGDSFHQNPTISAPRLDSFKMIKVIGKGSFGKVFLVREIKTGEMFALKVLRKDNIIKRNQVEHTRTERSVLGYVKHPFIVGLNMAFQSKDKLYFVLDYCAGGELFFHLGKLGKFPESRACFYAAEITLAISYVHELDIIYRDLKPENVLLDARGHVRLTDFGLSKEGISNSSSGANSFCGTPEYLAPEILNRQGHGRAVDWWSLGALLYEMLTGLPPFYCRDREKLFEKIRKGDLTYPRYLSPRSVALLRGLLTRDPRGRLGSGPTDADDIKGHPFFADIQWEKLAGGQVAPPWDPQISGSLDTSQFDREFTSMPIFSPGSLQQHGGFVGGVTPQENVFEGFTFTDRTFYPSEA